MAANHGGKRKGSGRKKGASTKKTREVADALMSDGGVTPLEVLMTAMRHEVALQENKKHLQDRDYSKAAAYAKDAAPYCHPRLASVAHTDPDGAALGSNMSALELARRWSYSLVLADREKEEAATH